MDELLNHAPCGFLSFGDDGTVTAANATLLELLGYPREELVGKPVGRILTVGSRIFYQTHFFPLLRLHGRAEEIFLMLRTREGEDVGVLTNALRRTRAGALANDCVFMRVRERQKYEDELLRAKKVAEQASSALEVRKRELERANSLLEAQALELQAQHEQLQEQAVELEAASEELHTINEELIERSVEQERLRREAEEANRAKSNFLAVMSHELRTPLNAIAGYAQLLEMGIHGPVTDPQRQALERIDRSQRHLLRLINDVLNLARIEAGRVDYLVADVQLATLVAEVLPLVEPQLAEKELRLEVDLPPGLAVRADPDKLQQILLNLLSNAIKFTAPGGSVTIAALRPHGEPGSVALRISDTGIGIPAAKLSTIFEPFVQVDTSRAGRAEGTGLGLAISRDLARGMGGELRAVSTLGVGSTFTLTLPAAGSRPGASEPE